ncbi:U2 snRNP complex subunit [Microbotryomycetes sp. JL201]|nr:U2 snRNP complex subunit [Microbotryomycetes sp. JL201]
MRLDAELLARSPSYLNPLKDRELDLRGHKIPAIENLGVTKDTIDCLDLTDNSVTSLSNFPLMRRLQHILISNNPVRTVSPTISTSLPNLRTLILTNAAVPRDALANLGDILGRCKKLETLSLKGTPVADAEHYRSWIIFKCKNLRSLDFERVKEKVPPSLLPRTPITELTFFFPASLPRQERVRAQELFMSKDGTPTALATAFAEAAASNSAANAPTLVAANGVKTFEPGVEPAATGKAGRLLTKEEKERVRQAIEGAESVEEIRRLQRMLAQGFVPTEKDLKELERAKKAAA